MIAKGTTPGNACCQADPHSSTRAGVDDDHASEVGHGRPNWAASPSTTHPESESDPPAEQAAERMSAESVKLDVSRERVGWHWEHQHEEIFSKGHTDGGRTLKVGNKRVRDCNNCSQQGH